MIVSILIPVCSRNQTYSSFEDTPFMKKFYPSFLSTKSHGVTYNIYIGYDDDDVFYIENIDKFKSITEHIVCLKNCQHAPAKAWNTLAEKAHSTSNYLFQIGDDVILETPGWTEHFINRLVANNNIGVVGPCNLLNYNQRKNAGRPAVIENSFVSVKHFQIFGYFFHPSITNWYCDDWISRIYDSYLSEIQLKYTCRNTIVDSRYKIETPSNFNELVENGISRIKRFNSNKVFSYCLYGNQKKYCLGMLKNLKQINKLFPDFIVYIYLGNDVPQEYIDQYISFQNVKLIHHNFTGGRLMSHRYFVLENEFDFIFIRDADSRFGERDLWCMGHFLNSNSKIFTLRDHKWHGRELLGGQTGFKNFSIPTIRSLYDIFVKKQSDIDRYQSDQDFIIEYIFYKNKQDVIAYSEYHNFGEGSNIKIPFPRKSIEDFCGNVYLFDKNDNEYTEFTIHGKK
jgi:hypothetical protein